MQYPRLFQEGSIGGVAIRNRIVLPPMATNFSGTDGVASDRTIQYYRERARGGVGLVIVEAAYVDLKAKHRTNAMSFAEDCNMPGMRKLAGAIRAEGAMPAIQLGHNGRLISSRSSGGLAPLAPSVIPHRATGRSPREATLDDIQSVTESFAAAAARVAEAGFSMVELHGGHGYLLQQFLSPYSNHRADHYGGSFQQRARFPLEVVRAVLERVGSFPVTYRLSATELMEGGLGTEEMIQFALMLQAEGIAALHVSVGVNETAFTVGQVIQSMYYEPGNLAKYAGAIKQRVTIPVIAVGRINSPEVAESILARGDADFVATGRALIADPHWPRKAMEGRTEDIRKCVACNVGCIGRIGFQQDIKCAQNPWVGTEFEAGIPAAPVKKRVVILGGGPAGLEAARVAAARGHKVTLYEKQPQLGGQIALASVPPGKAELQEIVRIRKRDLARLGVDVRCGVTATPEDISSNTTDAVIEATGGAPASAKVYTDFPDRVVSSWSVLTGRPVAGRRVLVMGGGMVGLEVADLLAAQGKQVVVTEILDEVGQNITQTTRATLLSRLENAEVEILTGVVLERWGAEGVVLRKKDGSIQRLNGIEDVVVATGSRPNRVDMAKPENVIWKRIGDCEKPRDILSGVCEAAEAAMSL